MHLPANLLVGQSGGPTAVINCSLAGIIEEALRHPEIKGIYGLRRGLEGLLAGDLIDLRQESPETIRGLRDTPSAALGSCRRRLQSQDVPRALEILRTFGIRYFLYIGGNDSADTSHRLALAAQEAGYPLTVIGVPKTIDNDLPAMDHTPGYPSIARYVAIATKEIGLDAEATANVDPVRILEVMGRNAGWVAAAAALGKESPAEAPHLIYVPERPFSADKFLTDVQAIYRRLGRVVIVITETVRDESNTPWAIAVGRDAFGHPRLEGAAQRLCNLVRQRLGLRARFDKPGTLQRASSLCISSIDQEEAYMVGVAAVQAALAGETDKMVTLIRVSQEPYRCVTGLAPLVTIANAERRMPEHFLNQEGNFVTEAFLAYARPLLGGPLPRYVRLRGVPVTAPSAQHGP